MWSYKNFDGKQEERYTVRVFYEKYAVFNQMLLSTIKSQKFLNKKNSRRLENEFLNFSNFSGKKYFTVLPLHFYKLHFFYDNGNLFETRGYCFRKRINISLLFSNWVLSLSLCIFLSVLWNYQFDFQTTRINKSRKFSLIRVVFLHYFYNSFHYRWTPIRNQNKFFV